MPDENVVWLPTQGKPTNKPDLCTHCVWRAHCPGCTYAKAYDRVGELYRNVCRELAIPGPNPKLQEAMMRLLNEDEQILWHRFTKGKAS